jgi:hypothetical protein
MFAARFASKKLADKAVEYGTKEGTTAIANYVTIGAGMDYFTGGYASGMTISGVKKVVDTSSACVKGLGDAIKNTPSGPIDGGF